MTTPMMTPARKIPLPQAGRPTKTGNTASACPPAEELASLFKALGDPLRLKILALLNSKGVTCCELVAPAERGLCACDIETATGLSQAAVSHQMGLLVRAGLVKSEKRGRWVFYRRNQDFIEAAAAQLKAWV